MHLNFLSYFLVISWPQGSNSWRAPDSKEKFWVGCRKSGGKPFVVNPYYILCFQENLASRRKKERGAVVFSNDLKEMSTFKKYASWTILTGILEPLLTLLPNPVGETCNLVSSSPCRRSLKFPVHLSTATQSSIRLGTVRRVQIGTSCDIKMLL